MKLWYSMTRDKRERFIHLAERRVDKTVNQMKLIGNLGNHNLYTSTPEEREQIENYLTEKLEFHLKRLKAGKKEYTGFIFSDDQESEEK